MIQYTVKERLKKKKVERITLSSKQETKPERLLRMQRARWNSILGMEDSRHNSLKL